MDLVYSDIKPRLPEVVGSILQQKTAKKNVNDK